MFFPFLAATTVGIGLFKLGTLSVWMTVLTIAIQILIIALLALGGFTLWQRHRDTKK